MYLSECFVGQSTVAAHFALVTILHADRPHLEHGTSKVSEEDLLIVGVNLHKLVGLAVSGLQNSVGIE